MSIQPNDIDNLSDESLFSLARNRDTEPIVLDRIAKTHIDKIELLKLIVKNPSTPGETISFISQNSPDETKEYIASKKYTTPADKELDLTEEEREILLIEKEHRREVKDRTQNLYFRIQRMSVSEKIQLALKGNKEARSVLIRDPNKDVCLAVVENPKITETEIEFIAQSRNVPEDVLRNIAKNREWIKNYSIVNSLINNPKTPVGISLSLLSTLKNKELHVIEKSKNVPSVLKITAKRLLTQRTSRS